MPQHRYLLFIRCVLHLIAIFPHVSPIGIKCEEDAQGIYVCTNTTLPAHFRDCCYNHELDQHYCCPHYELRSQLHVNRSVGLIVVAVIIVPLIFVLCIFCERCPGRWYLKKCIQRRGSSNATNENEV